MTPPATSDSSPDGPPDAAPPLPLDYDADHRACHVRWWICGLLFFATTINYVDRAVLGVLAPTLKETSAGPTSSTATSTPPSPWRTRSGSSSPAGSSTAWARGWLRGYLVVWSLAAAGHALRRTASFGIAAVRPGHRRIGQLPRRHQDHRRVVPQEGARAGDRHLQRRLERRRHHRPGRRPLDRHSPGGWQIGVRHHRPVRAGLGRLLAAPLPPPAGTPAALARGAGVRSRATRPTGSPKSPGSTSSGFRQTWAFAIGKFLTDSIWWFYLFWFPVFMRDRSAST